MSEHNGWTPRLAMINTLATVVGAFTGVSALLIALVMLLR